MSSKRTNILQIQKYLNGELDKDAMHRLEREAQDDPFLMDALDGFEKAAPNQQKNLDELRQRLQQKGNTKQARIIPLSYWAAAASVVLVLGFGGLWYRHSVTKQRPLIAQADKAMVKPALPPAPAEKANTDAALPLPEKGAALYDAKKIKPPVAARVKDTQTANQAATLPVPEKHTVLYNVKKIKPPVAANQENIPVAAETAATIKSPAMAANQLKEITVSKDTADLSEMVITGYATQKKKGLTARDTAINTDKSYEQVLRGRVAGVQATPGNRNAMRYYPGISGIVVDKGDGMPIPGVNIRVLGTSIGTQTDADGKFILSGVKDKGTLSIANLGYKTEQVKLKGKDSLNIVLSTDSKALNEVVETGYNNSNSETQQGSAQPQKGWDSYKQYLKAGGETNSSKKGTVKLQFTVSGNGDISDIRILKSLDKAADEKAIGLIKNGPGWVGNTSNKPETVKINISFNKR